MAAIFTQHPSVDYAYYLKGLASFDQDRGILARFLPLDMTKRDPGAARDSFNEFAQLTTRFPNSRYAPDAKARMVYLRNLLAANEIHVADYYLRRQAYVAAANRGRYVVENFQGTPTVNGFKAHLGVAAREDGVDDAKAASSGALTYAAGKFSVSVAAESRRTHGGESFTGIAGSYDFGFVKVMSGYSKGFYGTKGKGPSVGFVAPVAGFNVGMHYGKNSETKVDATEFFVNREIFKNTYAYLDYGHLDNHNAPSNKAYALGVIYVFDLAILGH